MVYEEHYSINCKCGNPISYVDSVFEGGRDTEWYTITCNDCRKEFQIRANSITRLDGGTYTTSNTGPPCPFCELKLTDFKHMNNDDADDLLYGVTASWCEKHAIAYAESNKDPKLSWIDRIKLITKY